MRKSKQFILLFVLSFFAAHIQATTYYVKQNGGTTTTGKSDATAWNYATLNGKILSPGDSVLFKRGETFFGELTVSNGSTGRMIHYGAYGTGANPIISGLHTVSSWERHSGNVYYADMRLFNLTAINLVTLNNQVMTMGRYPNSGYLNYTSHSGNTSISGNTIRNLPFNAVGGEAVVRKVRWILDRQPVASHSGSTLTLSQTSLDGGSVGYEAVDKNGFFIQNHLATLDRDGEWYYDRRARRLYMYLNTTERLVRVAVLQRLAALNSKGNVRFTDIDFEGSNIHGMSINGGTNIMFERCHFYNHGQTAIYGNGASNLTIREGNIQHCLNNGIWIEQGGYGVKVDGMKVTDIGLAAGAGRSGDGAQQAISVHGTNISITNCQVRRIGYNGINFDGKNAVVEHNLVDSFCLVKDDGGGIYTYENDGVVVANRIVRNNIVLHAVGAFAGAEGNYYEQYGKAAGIYLDGFSNNTTVINNVVAHGEWAGIFVNNNSNNQIIGNLFYNHAASIHLLQGKAGNIRNLIVKGNECIARTKQQKTLYVRLFESDNAANLGTFSANFYARPVDDTKTIMVEKIFSSTTENLSLSQWRTQYGEDATSGTSHTSTDDPGKLRFEYNASVQPRVLNIKGAWKDIYNTLYQTSLVLPSFGGKVMISTSTVTPTLPVKENSFTATQAGSSIRLDWKGIGETDAVFNVERSGNGADFVKIGDVQASGSAQETAYLFTDKQPLTGVNYYRLKTVETTGSYSFTKVVNVKMPTQQVAMQVFPNPASDRITVQLPAQNEPVVVKLTDMSGKTLNTSRVPASPGKVHHAIDISHLPRGQYLLTANQTAILFLKQ